MQKKEWPRPGAVTVQSARPLHPFESWMGYTPLAAPDDGLYAAMREAVPIIDAALDKIVRLTGGFALECSDKKLQLELDRFVQTVRVGPCSYGLHEFVTGYFDGLLTYGNAVGEMILSPEGDDVAMLYNARLADVRIRRGRTPFEAEICASTDGLTFAPVRYPQLVLFTPLNPAAGEIRGTSLLRSLPFVAGILLKIWNSTGVNFERVANLRYAVTYKPGASGADQKQARDIAEAIAQEWADAMQSQKNGTIKDFVAVGDVEVKVIGADGQTLDSEVPVKQMLEQIVAKLGIPPFMLGLHWSSTERMSAQQADILTSELESYRRLLGGVIHRILKMWTHLRGSSARVQIKWDDVNLQDEMEAANVRYITAQAAQIEQKIETEGNGT